MQRLLGFLGRSRHAGLAGALFFVAVRASDPEASRIGSFAFGWAYGVAVLLLVRLFPIRVDRAGALPVAGLLAGPVPAALLLARELDGEWRPAWLLLTLLGAAIGTLEWASARGGLVAGGDRSRDDG